MGVAFSHEGRLEDARKAYDEALTIFRELGNRDGEAGIWNDLGNILNRENQVAQSKHAYEQSLSIYRDLKDAQGIGLAVGNIAMAEASMGDNVHAKAHFQEAITLDRATGDQSALAGDLTNVAVVMQAEADFKGAGRALREAADVSRDMFNKVTGAETGLAPDRSNFDGTQVLQRDGTPTPYS